jgi:hypothetical protein
MTKPKRNNNEFTFSSNEIEEIKEVIMIKIQEDHVFIKPLQ